MELKMPDHPPVPVKDLFINTIWADPNKNENFRGFGFNDTRRISVFWGRDMAEKFLRENELSMIVRGHEWDQEGYK